MAVSQPVWVDPRLQDIVELVAHGVARHGVVPGEGASSKGILRIELEDNVKRIIQVYWTGFEADVPDQSIGVHLEVAEPKVHWAEAYLSPYHQNWIFCFHERADGDVQLAHYQQHAKPADAIQAFFDLAGWYVLTATDLTWDDVAYEVSPHLD